MLNVICFYWLGDRWAKQDKGLEYVNRLYHGVERNLKIKHKFICFTNEATKGRLDRRIEVRPINFPYFIGTGVLPRMFMFSAEAGFNDGDQILVLDLDVIITGSLEDIAGYSGPFCVRSKFAPGQEYKADGDIIGFQVSNRLENIFWYDFINRYSEVVHTTGGRERYWFRQVIENHFPGRDCDRWQSLYPGQIVSFKRHVRRQGKLPGNVRIVSCHGKPRPHQINQKWAKENWR